MDVRIGVTYSSREVELQMADDTDRADLRSRVDAALESGEGVLWIEDRKGREVGVPASKITFVEIGSATESRRMGFSS